ncbi:hypothetical protein [Nocardioides sp. NPDC006303]|uniref:hypothetical protein n=1 Tax=Nocardioides sp. NPDC006303 TaxID=3156747 RepID=UPI0033A99EA1
MPVSAQDFEPQDFHGNRPWLVRPVRIDPAGKVGPTRGQVAGKGWRRASRGFYLPARYTADTPEQRIVEAAMVLGPHDAVTGWAALRWLGAEAFDGLEVRRPQDNGSTASGRFRSWWTVIGSTRPGARSSRPRGASSTIDGSSMACRSRIRSGPSASR